MPDARTVKVLLLGQSGVGKSSLMLRFADGIFNEEQASTIGVDFRVKTVDVDGVGPVKLQVWDTAGQERFRTLTKSYYRGASAIVFVHDITSAASLDNISHWMDEAETFCAGRPLVKLLVSNKIDCLTDSEPASESREQAIAFARANRMIHFFCSAKNDEGVQAAFAEIAAQVAESDDFASDPRCDVVLSDADRSRGGFCACYVVHQALS